MKSPMMSPVASNTLLPLNPSIDYVVTKIPRFAFEKFPGAQTYTRPRQMKSVGEAMAMGRSFQGKSCQKALRGLWKLA